MKKQPNMYRSFTVVGVITALILMVPLVAMQFTGQVVWTVSDFVVAGALLFAVGVSYVGATRSAPNILYRIAIACGLGTTLLLIWANLAVGLIGSGPNAGNLMYIAVLIVGVIGVLRSQFQSSGMEYVMYAMALALVFVTAIALMTGIDQYPGSSMNEILGVNAFFAVSFVISGLLFREASRGQARATND